MLKRFPKVFAPTPPQEIPMTRALIASALLATLAATAHAAPATYAIEPTHTFVTF